MPAGGGSVDRAPDSQRTNASSKLERRKYSFITTVIVHNFVFVAVVQRGAPGGESGAVRLRADARGDGGVRGAARRARLPALRLGPHRRRLSLRRPVIRLLPITRAFRLDALLTDA